VSGGAKPVDREAATHHRVANNQEEWGAEVLERLRLAGDETVLDAGCGSGRVTRLLLERLERGHVLGVDASPAMIEEARSNLREFGDRVELRVGDLTEVDLAEAVDAVFSNATFHWISDHNLLFSRLFSALRPGGALEAQCGGEGNVAEWKRAVESAIGDERFARYFRDVGQPWNFASVADTRTRLKRAGFEIGDVWLERRTVEPREPRDYIRSVGLNPHLAHLPAELHDDFVDLILGSMLRPLRIEYVRLNISARKP
jgi:trans-aconitate 2-methyltransferase